MEVARTATARVHVAAGPEGLREPLAVDGERVAHGHAAALTKPGGRVVWNAFVHDPAVKLDTFTLELEPVDVKGHKVVPRDAFISIVGPRLRKPEGRDLVALRVEVTGVKGGQPKTVGWELIDRYDERTGITAMMRTTGYSLSITGQLQAKREVAPGVHTPDEGMPAERYIAELQRRGIQLKPIDY